MKDGLSQQERIQRTRAINSFEPLDDSMETLLRQAGDIASFIRYYNSHMQSDGYFDAFLDEIKHVHPMENPAFDGNMEPSQAVLYTFLHNQKGIIQSFNQKWKEQYISWYFNRILSIQPKALVPDFTWISFKSGIKEKISIEKGHRFTYSETPASDKIYYCLAEDIEVNTIKVVKTLILSLEKNKDIFPANLFDFPVAVHKKNYLMEDAASPAGQGRYQSPMQAMGLHIISPSFLLESGKRKICLYLQPEKQQAVSFEQKRKIVRLLQKEKEQKPYLNQKEIREITYINLLNTLFYLEISTGNGWEDIGNYTVHFKENSLIIQFLLEESFPPTTACNVESHGTMSEYPGLKILLNHNAWLYPYAWLKDFHIKKIMIDTRVENMSNQLFYNDLGLVDTSMPFSPFGINTEKGSSFVLGSYEMAKKNISSVDVKIQWNQLPVQENGLYDYYYDYQENINNYSFKICPKYLSDYKWQNTDNAEPFYLFSTIVKDSHGRPETKGKLSAESVWKSIQVKDITPVLVKKEEYKYTTQSKTGFFSFTLEEPDMGLGEKHYRQLYTKLLMSKKFRKEKEIKLNEPLNPQVSRITLSYTSCDEIDLRTCSKTQESRLYHVYPLGEQLIYPKQDNRPLPVVYGLNQDTNILFALENVAGDEVVSLYFEFLPLKNEISLSDLPVIIWYWGDGYHWERLPDDAILRNTTQNLLTNGVLKLYIPPVPEKDFRDADGLIWIAAGIVKNEHYIAPLVKLHHNVARVTRDSSQLEQRRPEDFCLNESEKEIPGITGIVQVSLFKQKQEPETEEQKILRLSEYVSHRQRAVTARDYERITLQAFPGIEKAKCLYDSKKKKVTLVIIPRYIKGQNYARPCAQPELLLNVEKYFKQCVSAAVNTIDAIHPVYEEIMVRCEAALTWINYSNAASRAILTKTMNQLIAPWQKNNEAPCLGYSFTVQEMYDKISRLNQVEDIKQLSVVHIYQDETGKCSYKEYTEKQDRIRPSVPHAVLVPCQKHLFVSKQQQYGLEEMNINENFII